MAPKTTRLISKRSHPGQFSSKGAPLEGRLFKNSSTMPSSRISPIQRGTSRPLGKSRKNARSEAFPRKLRRLRGKMRTGEGNVSAPLNTTREKAASNANQSSDLRQKMRKPTPYQIASMITKKMVSRAGYPLAAKPL